MPRCRRIFRLVATVVVLGGLAASSGCSVVKNPFFQMTSDSPNPFFGAEIAFPPKFTSDD